MNPSIRMTPSGLTLALLLSSMLLSGCSTINETLSFTLKLLEEDRLTHADAVDQLRQEIEAAVGDLGLEHHVTVDGQEADGTGVPGH